MDRDLIEIKKHWDNTSTVSLKDTNLQKIERYYILKTFEKIGQVVLLADIGCGDASDTIYWCDYANEVYGYDYSLSMLELAKRNYNDKIKLYQLDLLNDNININFDVIVTKRCLINLGNFENQKKSIFKIHKWIKKNGFYIMLECCMDGLDNLNSFRKNFELEPIKEPFHNKYFNLKILMDYINEYFYVIDVKNFSTYYFLTRVYNQIISKERYTEFDAISKMVHERIDMFGSTIIGPQFLMVLKKRE